MTTSLIVMLYLLMCFVVEKKTCFFSSELTTIADVDENSEAVFMLLSARIPDKDQPIMIHLSQHLHGL